MQNKLRFSVVASAVEATPKALRKMLQNSALVLPGPKQDGWTEFSLIQLAILAVSRRLIEFGFSVGEASKISVDTILEALPEADGLRGLKSLNATTFLKSISKRYLIARFENGARVVEFATSVPDSTSATTLIVPAGAIVERAFDYASVGPNDDMTGADIAIIEAFSKDLVNRYRTSSSASRRKAS